MALGIEFAPRVGASSRSQLHEFLVFELSERTVSEVAVGGGRSVQLGGVGSVKCGVFCSAAMVAMARSPTR